MTLVLLFGAGLIGGRIAAAFGRRGWRIEEESSPWDDVGALELQLSALQHGLAVACPRRVDVIWSAGRAGFASSEKDTRGEEDSFRRVLAFARGLRLASGGPTVFHLVSSAGGLYEGQRHIDSSSRPRPRRPYGKLKLRQERLLMDVDATFSRRIYRLSSVFGPADRRGRRGLISTLLYNTRRGRTTSIIGQIGTLRDYLWTEDIARHLANECERPAAPASRIEILASGKPTTIHEVLRHIAKVVGKPPAIRFPARSDNSADITFARSLLPVAWSPTDLETAIRQLHLGCVGGPDSRLWESEVWT